MARFIDRVTLHAAAGNGGHGCNSVHREKFKPLGGPDGGNGGRGGSIVLSVDPQVQTLLDFHFHPHATASKGQPGMGSNKNGSWGDDLTLGVPLGTVVNDEDGNLLADLSAPGMQFIVAQGGRGGLGNAALVSKNRKAPGFALLGEPGEERSVVLELKSVADVGLVGFPSAGKSSLVSAISSARPKIADYPFTTLQPNLGVVSVGHDTLTVADVPGLIPGAAEGRGLGLDFLRHLERTAVLVHVVDCATLEPGRDPLSDIEALEKELNAYQEILSGDVGLGKLSERPRVVVLNKLDVPEARELAEMVRPEIEELGWPVFEISTVAHTGLDALCYALLDVVKEARAKTPVPELPRVVIRPAGSEDNDRFSIVRDPDVDGGFIVRGVKPERWVRQTAFDNDEAVGFLADRLAKLGVEDALAVAGAQPGCPVTIGDVCFNWEPMTGAGADILLTRRGTDPRLEGGDRVSASERRHAKRVRRGLAHIDSDADDQSTW